MWAAKSGAIGAPARVSGRPSAARVSTAMIEPALAGDPRRLVLDAGAIRLVGASRGLGHEERVVRDGRLETGFAEDRAVALVLEAQGEVLAAALDDPALGEDVDDVGGDVVQQALVVRDQEDAELRVQHRVDALGDDPQRVDVEARVGLVEDRDLRLEDAQLEPLESLLLAAAEALVDVPRREGLV